MDHLCYNYFFVLFCFSVILVCKMKMHVNLVFPLMAQVDSEIDVCGILLHRINNVTL